MNKDELKKLEKDLWKSADNLRANSDLKSSEYSIPVLGLIFLKFADNIYKKHEESIVAEYEKLKGSRVEKEIHEIAVEKCGFYLPEKSRYDYLLNLPEDQDMAAAIKAAMQLIEDYKPELADILPKNEYARFNSSEESRGIPKQLLRNFADIPADTEADLFGQIYEYFLGEFAMAEGQGGGEFFTPRSVVRLMVEMIEPIRGEIFDPACGSGGMFVQSAHYANAHNAETGAADLYVCGQEKTLETVKLAKMNLAVNGLRGDIKQAITYYTDAFNSFERFDYVLANPPFNVDDVSLSAVEKDPRFNTYGIPRNKTKKKKSEQGKETVPNANYLWINLFATSLKPGGRAGLVMANSASDGRHSEAEIRKTLIDNNLIYSMLTLPSNMFYTVTLPATLWFFDKGKTDNNILFIDTRNIFTQIDRAHREFSEEQVQNIAIISRLHRGRRDEFVGLIDRYFTQGVELLKENREKVKPMSEKLTSALSNDEGKKAVDDLVGVWETWLDVVGAYFNYNDGKRPAEGIDELNGKQRDLRAKFDPFFIGLHDCVKRLDRVVRAHEKALVEKAEAAGKRSTVDRETKALKSALEELHNEVKEAEVYFRHIAWLQDRFPEAKYEDVTGLCKLATPAEVREQDYSLNPGRYVGVVIEEDGKTEEEFLQALADMHLEFSTLSEHARRLEGVITNNLSSMVN